MTTKTFIKTLSANDVGTTGGHMGGILVPKGDGELLAFLPPLDPNVLNPSAWIECDTPDGQSCGCGSSITTTGSTRRGGRGMSTGSPG
jgi:hypothetical protein